MQNTVQQDIHASTMGRVVLLLSANVPQLKTRAWANAFPRDPSAVQMETTALQGIHVPTMDLVALLPIMATVGATQLKTSALGRVFPREPYAVETADTAILATHASTMG